MIRPVNAGLMQNIAHVLLQSSRQDEVIEPPADVASTCLAKVRPERVRVTFMRIEMTI